MGSQHLTTWAAVRNVALAGNISDRDDSVAYGNFGPNASTTSQLPHAAAKIPSANAADSSRKPRRYNGQQRLTKRVELSAAPGPDPDAVIINDVPVSFPFLPYAAQREYMTALIRALRNRENALLESPTGTGKTLSLLCATLAWRAAHLTGKIQSRAAAVRGPGSSLKHLVDDLPDVDTAGDVAQIDPEFQIIYSSRTHAQLAQVMQELRRTVYSGTRTGLLGSRDQFCINPSIYEAGKKSHSLLTRLCKVAVQKGTCEDYKAFDHLVRTNNEVALAASVDIEDIAKQRMRKGGSSKTTLSHACPFHASRHVAESAEIVFMPYNYLLDMVTRARSQRFFKLKDAVIIVDEGHNIAQTCEEAASFQFRLSDISAAIEEVKRFTSELDDRPNVKLMFSISSDAAEEAQLSEKKTVSREDLTKVCEALAQMDDAFKGITNTPMLPMKPLALQDIMNRVREKTKISYENVTRHLNALDFVMEDVDGAADGAGMTSLPVDIIRTALLMLFFPHGIANAGNGELPRQVNATLQEAAAKSFYSSYLVTVNDPPPPTMGDGEGAVQRKPGDKLVRCMCLSPHNALRSLLKNGVRSLIITSGTLSPMNLLSAELGIPLQVQLACRHIIDSTQISGLIVSQAPPPPPQPSTATYVSAFLPAAANQNNNNNNIATEDFSKQIILRADFNNRNNTEYQLALGAAILKCLHCVPGGVLVFFASYSFMESCLRIWHERAGIMNGMKASKIVFTENRDRDQFRADLLSFREAVVPAAPVEQKFGMFSKTIPPKKTKGAVFFAVCRGKVSEGIDFPDDCARAVIIVGIPFINTKEERVIMKRFYLDRQRGQLASGSSGSVLPLTGSQWYTREAWVAVNQAIGRVIRHRDDYGVCILMDDRFLEEFQRVRRDLQSGATGAVDAPQTFCSNLPRYIHDSLVSYPFNKTLAILRRFFAINSKESVVQRRMENESGRDAVATASLQPMNAVPSGSSSGSYTGSSTARVVEADHDNDSIGSVEFIQNSGRLATAAGAASSSNANDVGRKNTLFPNLLGEKSKVKPEFASSSSQSVPVAAPFAVKLSEFQAAFSRKRADRRARAAEFKQHSPATQQHTPRSRVRARRTSRSVAKSSGKSQTGSGSGGSQTPGSPMRAFLQKSQLSSSTQRLNANGSTQRNVNTSDDVITIDSSDDDDEDADANIRSNWVGGKFSQAATQPVVVGRTQAVVPPPAKKVGKNIELGSMWKRRG